MTIAIDQANIGETANDTALASIAITTSAIVAAGGFIVLTATLLTPVTVTSISGGGLTWSIDKQGVAAGAFANNAVISAQAPSGLSSGTVITATFSGTSSGANSLCGTSFTGVATSSPVDVTNTLQHGTTTAWTTGNMTIAAGSLIVACAADFNALHTSTPTSPSIEAHDFGNGGFAQTTCYRIEAAGGTVTVDGTWSAAADGTTAAVAYKAAAAATLPGLPNVVDSAVARASSW